MNLQMPILLEYQALIYTTQKEIYETQLPDDSKIPDQNDANSAILVEKLKKPLLANIKFKRERLEFKIKKMFDYTEQLNELVDQKAIAKTQTTQLLNQLEQLFNNENKNHLFKTTDEMKNYLRGATPLTQAV